MKPALREINPSAKTARVIPLNGLGDNEELFEVARDDGGNILLISAQNLWSFDPRTSRVTKLCSPPSGKTFNGIAYDPKSQAAYVLIEGEDEKLFVLKNGHELMPAVMRPPLQIKNLAFSSDGKVFYEAQGDIWCGEIKANADNLRVEANRCAEGKDLMRAAKIDDMGDPAGALNNLAVAGDGIYVQVWLYHNRGMGFGGLLKLPLPARNADAKFLADTKRPVLLGTSSDGSRVYYTNDDQEYLVTNGRAQKLRLRKVGR